MLVLTLALLASRASYIPTWDGRIYADCIVDAGERHLALSTLRCVDHISHAYMLFAGAIQMLSPGSFPLMLLANVILYLIACAQPTAGVYWAPTPPAIGIACAPPGLG